MTVEISFSQALTEVRKAHRLLWNFYDRLIPACEQLMKEFYPATYYYSDYCWPGNRSNNPLLQKSMYYILPYMSMDILYGYNRKNSGWHDNPNNGDYLLVLSLQLDTAFSDNTSSTINIENINSELFPSPYNTETQVLLTTIYCNKKLNNKNWHGDVYYGDWHYTPGKVMPYNLDNSDATDADAEFIAYGCKLDLEKELGTPQAVKCAANRIRQEVKKYIPKIKW